MNFDNHIRNYFGEEFVSAESRRTSYDFIETYISNNVESWETPPDTDELTENFSELIEDFSNSQLEISAKQPPQDRLKQPPLDRSKEPPQDRTKEPPPFLV